MSECRTCHRKLRQGNVCKRCARSAARSVRQPSPLAGKKACVWVERNGAGIKIEDVPAAQAAAVLADMLEAMRALTEHFPELVQDLTPVPGGSPVVYEDDWSYDGKKRVGFTR